MAKTIMIQGTMSSAGKSILTTGLCRLFRQDGYSVAPFKSQNMSRNSFLTEEGLLMSNAQAIQAEAAGVKATPLMNPVLLKPVTDMGSEVIVNGQSRGHMRAAEYFKYKKNLVTEIMQSFESLSKQYDIIVIEGAGSPVEINLKQNDIVNMGLAKMTDSPVLLVGDIDCGGVFAQIVGTLVLLEEDERARVKGTIVNKFRGDIEITGDGKGKTTAALGLILRASGCGMRVVLVQLLKGRDTGELNSLKNLQGVTVLRYSHDFGFFASAKEHNKIEMMRHNNENLTEAFRLAKGGLCDLLVLDEICAAYNNGSLDVAIVDNLILNKPPELELVLTGRNAPKHFIDAADYVSEFIKRKHPYDSGIAAREGVEF